RGARYRVRTRCWSRGASHVVRVTWRTACLQHCQAPASYMTSETAFRLLARTKSAKPARASGIPFCATPRLPREGARPPVRGSLRAPAGRRSTARHGQGEARSRARLARGGERAVVRPRQLGRDGQADSAARRLGGRLAAPEPVEDARELVGG